jgi:predicted aldo/keto reductase-like oxidoreductase
MPPEVGARNCVKCGDCEEKCPQHLPIQNLLSKTIFLLERASARYD